jgi:hypothetical protein
MFEPDDESDATAVIYDDDLRRWPYIDGYKRAANILVETMSGEWTRATPMPFEGTYPVADSLALPIMFLYRHYLEIRLKDLIERGSDYLSRPQGWPKAGHDIGELWALCRPILEEIFPETPTSDNDRIAECICSFMAVDASGEGFRYDRDNKGNPSLGGISRVGLRTVYETMQFVGLYLDGAGAGIEAYEETRNEMNQYFADDMRYHSDG